LILKDEYGSTFDISSDTAVGQIVSFMRDKKADKIYKTDKKVLSVNIVNTATDTIWCQSYWDKKSPLFGILKKDVNSIAFKNGVTKYFTPQAVAELMASLSHKKQGDSVSAHLKLIPKQRSVGLNVNIGSPALFFSWNVDVFLSQYMSLELGTSFPFYGSLYGGAKFYYPFKHTQTEYTAIYTGMLYSFVSFGESGVGPLLYLPLGLHSTTKRGFNFSAEIALAAIIGRYGGSNGYYRAIEQVKPWGQLRFGYRF
jgi:hypothetical protein